MQLLSDIILLVNLKFVQIGSENPYQKILKMISCVFLSDNLR